MIKNYRHKGDAIKALSDYRVGGYLVRFTDETDPDLYGEHFNKSTDFWLERGYPVVGSRVLLEHGLDSFAKVMPIGLIEMLKEDDIGLYIEAKLNDRAEYERMLQDMKNRKAIDFTDEEIAQKALLAEKTIRAIVETGKVGWSSGALPQSVEVNEETKHIKSWAIIEGSLTFTPAEPDGTEIAPIKSALEDLSTFLTTSIPAQPAREAQPIEQHADSNPSITFSSTSAVVDASSITWLPSQMKSTIKGITKMADALAYLRELAGSLNAFLSESGMENEEAEAMASAVVDEVKAETDEEEIKNAMEDEEVAKRIAEKAFAILDARQAKKQKAMNALDAVKEARIKKLERSAEPVDPYGAGGSNVGNPRKTNRIQVGDNLKYAHLGVDDMALGITAMMAQAKGSGIPVTLRNFVEGGVVSEEFVQTFKGKLQDFAKSNPYGNSQEGIKRNSAVKSFAMKANEIDGTLNTGYGAEWVGDFWSTTLWAKERYPLVYDKLVSKGMWVEELGQGVDTGYFPIEGADPTAYRAPQSIDLDATNRPGVTAKITPFATGYVSVTPSEVKIATAYTRIFDEDSLIRLAPQVNKQLTDKALETRDQILINGDTETGANTNINKIDGTPTSTGLTQDYYLTSNGFRKMALVTAPAASVTSAVSAGGTLTDAQYLTTRKLFSGELRPYLGQNALFIIDPDTYEASLSFASLKTDDVNATGATVREGELLKMWGVEVFNSGFLPEANTAGKQSTTASNNVHGTILGVFAKHWGVAYKRQIVIDVQFDALSGTYVYVLSMRIGVVARGTKAAVASYYVGN